MPDGVEETICVQPYLNGMGKLFLIVIILGIAVLLAASVLIITL